MAKQYSATTQSTISYYTCGAERVSYVWAALNVDACDYHHVVLASRTFTARTVRALEAAVVAYQQSGEFRAETESALAVLGLDTNQRGAQGHKVFILDTTYDRHV